MITVIKDGDNMPKKSHGMTGTRIYKMWHNIKSRCTNPNATKYYLYGGKGIKVCDEWLHSFENFYNWAMQNGYKDNLTIDRINSDKDYCPENCRFATFKEQNSHLKTTIIIEWNGKKMTLSQWSDYLGISYDCLSARYLRGWSIEDMFTTPTIKKIDRDTKNGKFKKHNSKGGDLNVKGLSARRS